MHPIVHEDLRSISEDYGVDWSILSGSRVMVTGANGFLPSYMLRTLLHLNDTKNLGVRIAALVRNADRARRRFGQLVERRDVELHIQDVCDPIRDTGPFDFIIHAASQASPKYYGSDPVGTIRANTLGTIQVLELATRCQTQSVLFFSSGEVYGHVTEDNVPTPETDPGRVDFLDVRSCYAEGKRSGETMCVCYCNQFGVPVRIVRPFHTYGPGLALDDGRVFADFVADIVAGRNIVLKSAGFARRAFCYLADATAGFFRVMTHGIPGEAYNVGNEDGETSIGELAELLAELFPEKRLRVDRGGAHSPHYLPSMIERNCPDTSKVRALGWEPRIGLREGFLRTVRSYL